MHLEFFLLQKKKLIHNHLICKQIDRAIASSSFIDLFSKCQISYGTFTNFHHAPIFFDTNFTSTAKALMFSFQSHWTLEQETLHIVTKQWAQSIMGSRFFRVQSKLAQTKTLLKTWRTKKFYHNNNKLTKNGVKISDLERKLWGPTFQ